MGMHQAEVTSKETSETTKIRLRSSLKKNEANKKRLQFTGEHKKLDSGAIKGGQVV